MKRAICALLSAIMLLSLCGCTSLLGSLISFSTDDFVPVTLGKIEGNRYTSDFAQLSFTLPEGGYFFSEEQLAEQMDISADTLAEARENPDLLLNIDTIYDMRAHNADDTAEVEIFFQNTISSGLSDYTSKEYVEEFVGAMCEVYDERGAVCTQYDPEVEVICGQGFWGARMDVDLTGTVLGTGTEVDWEQVIEYYCYATKVGSYMVTVIVFGGEPGVAESIINECFV